MKGTSGPKTYRHVMILLFRGSAKHKILPIIQVMLCEVPSWIQTFMSCTTKRKQIKTSTQRNQIKAVNVLIMD